MRNATLGSADASKTDAGKGGYLPAWRCPPTWFLRLFSTVIPLSVNNVNAMLTLGNVTYSNGSEVASASAMHRCDAGELYKQKKKVNVETAIFLNYHFRLKLRFNLLSTEHFRAKRSLRTEHFELLYVDAWERNNFLTDGKHLSRTRDQRNFIYHHC